MTTTEFCAAALTFQSTLSVRRATPEFGHGFKERLISIHALRKESDWIVQSLPESGDAISIHALRKESDVEMVLRQIPTTHFNPRSP